MGDFQSHTKVSKRKADKESRVWAVWHWEPQSTTPALNMGACTCVMGIQQLRRVLKGSALPGSCEETLWVKPAAPGTPGSSNPRLHALPGQGGPGPSSGAPSSTGAVVWETRPPMRASAGRTCIHPGDF